MLRGVQRSISNEISCICTHNIDSALASDFNFARYVTVSKI